jgi:hypothetical protein
MTLTFVLFYLCRHGDRNRVANILIVVTDGKSNDKQATLAAAQALHNTNIQVTGPVVMHFKNNRNPLTDLLPYLTRQSHKRSILLRVAAVSYFSFF